MNEDMQGSFILRIAENHGDEPPPIGRINELEVK